MQAMPAARGDPIMTGFGGRSFEFMGQPGNTYSLISEKVHKVVHLTRSVLLHPVSSKRHRHVNPELIRPDSTVLHP